MPGEWQFKVQLNVDLLYENINFQSIERPSSSTRISKYFVLACRLRRANSCDRLVICFFIPTSAIARASSFYPATLTSNLPNVSREDTRSAALMLGRLISRRVRRHPIGLWTSRPIQPWVQIPHNYIHTQSGKRSCLEPKILVSKFEKAKHSRSLFTEVIPPALLPPAIFTGLLLGLWTWKCFWIIVMQNKLLYLSWLPPFSRSDKIEDYLSECKPVQWEEKRIQSLDGTNLAVCEGRIPTREDQNPIGSTIKKSVVICYFQGNGGSTPLRLPLLSQILRTLAHKSKFADSDAEPDYSIVALSYRGYWKSSGRATQSGIERDAQAFLNWVSASYASPDTDLQIVLWGHSLGSAVASSVLSKYLTTQGTAQARYDKVLPPISGLIMEAPISSIKDMLISLYPQKWLPYRYLWPFSWNTWCTSTALGNLATWKTQNAKEMQINEPAHLTRSHPPAVPPIFIISAENDEVIPPYVAGKLEKKGQDLGLDIARKEVSGAMHTECPIKHDGREALVTFIRENTSWLPRYTKIS